MPDNMLSPSSKRGSLLAAAALAVTFVVAVGPGAPAASAQGRADDVRDFERGRIDRDGPRYGEAERYRARDEGYRDSERRFDDKRPGRWDDKAEVRGDAKDDAKPDGKRDGKPPRPPGKSGHIKLEVESGGATSVDVKCADDESMRACADITKELIDKLRAVPPKQP
jgi:hypothetical protein